MLVLVASSAAATAFFGPAFDAVVPDVVPASLLTQANSLDQFVRPLALRLAGPAVGGLLIEGVGVGWAFALNAATFAVSAAALLAMAPPTRRHRIAEATVAGDIKVGFAYVRKHVWLWGTFASAAVAYLCFMGPAEVLLPFLVKNDLHGSAADLGLVFAAGGVGSLGCAAIMGQRGIPRRDITFMYLAWTLATVAIAGYGLATAVWQLMIASIAFNGLETAGTIVWATAKQRHVPPALLGRVSSLDWLISIGLLPLSFALTGPVSSVLGVQGTLIAGGVVGGLVTFGALLLPGMRGDGRQARRPPADAPARRKGCGCRCVRHRVARSPRPARLLRIAPTRVRQPAPAEGRAPAEPVCSVLHKPQQMAGNARSSGGHAGLGRFVSRGASPHGSARF